MVYNEEYFDEKISGIQEYLDTDKDSKYVMILSNINNVLNFKKFHSIHLFNHEIFHIQLGNNTSTYRAVKVIDKILKTMIMTSVIISMFFYIRNNNHQ